MPRLGYFLVVLLAGCGPGRGDLTGRVTYAGKPIKVGSVSLSAVGQPPRTVAIEDGTYTFVELAAGPVQLAVHSPPPHKAALIAREAKGAKKVVPKAAGWIAIPEHYGHFDRAKLTFQIVPGPNRFDLDLKRP